MAQAGLTNDGSRTAKGLQWLEHQPKRGLYKVHPSPLIAIIQYFPRRQKLGASSREELENHLPFFIQFLRHLHPEAYHVLTKSKNQV
jgi:hypothetical protein